MKLYLDTSVVLKRYLAESGTEIADLLFDEAEAGELTITISMWNIGEVLGVFDTKHRQGWLKEKEFKMAQNNFAKELVKLIRLKAIEVTPIFGSVLAESWNVLMKYHIYEADALQMTTCRYGKNDALISNDEKLVEVSRKSGLQAFSITRDKEEIGHLLQY
ncbi:MAG: type II toxin-antitoxin system VapC family toxin [Candidatus Bathyarchaeota archaeon]|nr:type II toxin-antitoxin system VapC family toxin [Candidatus Bathyarchaeota archaeon]